MVEILSFIASEDKIMYLNQSGVQLFKPSILTGLVVQWRSSKAENSAGVIVYDSSLSSIF